MLDDRILDLLATSFWQILLPGLVITVPLAVVSFLLGLLLAVVCAVIRTANVSVLSGLVRFYVWIFRGTPLLVQLFIVYYGLPYVGITLEAIPAAIATFSLNVGAYCCETLRGSIGSVPKGQLEAGLCSGLTYLQTMRRIVLPQAFRTAFPALFNSFISLVKDTSLAANITVAEMFLAAQQIATRTYEPFWLYIEAAFIYLIFCTVLTQLQAIGEKYLARYEH